MESKKDELKRSILTHLNRNPPQYTLNNNHDPNTPHLEATCENFSTFHGEEKPSRCLLDEYVENSEVQFDVQKAKVYFNEQEAIEICPHFRPEQASKCKHNGRIQSKPLEDVRIVLKKYHDSYQRLKQQDGRNT